MLDHAASHGCVVAAPDLSGLTQQGLKERSKVIVAVYQYLKSLNGSLLSNRLDLTKVILLGHSTGGGSCLVAHDDLIAAGGPPPVAIGLIAPAVHGSGGEVAGLAAKQSPNPLLAIKGTSDTRAAGVDPVGVFNTAQPPRILVTINGANHFGYTDSCDAANTKCIDNDNEAGTISRLAQQLSAGAYLAALIRRYALGDASVTPYLTGKRAMELSSFGGAGITVQQDGVS